MREGETYEVEKDYQIKEIILQGKDGVRVLDIDPISVKKGELFKYEIRTCGHEIMGSEDENGDIPMRATQIEATYSIFSNSNKVRRKYRYIDVREIAPIHKIKKELVKK